MTNSTPQTTRILGYRLVRIYEVMRRQPNKIFVAIDFTKTGQMNSYSVRHYLDTLIALGLIEKVKAPYFRRKASTRTTKGYRSITNKGGTHK